MTRDEIKIGILKEMKYGEKYQFIDLYMKIAAQSIGPDDNIETELLFDSMIDDGLIKSLWKGHHDDRATVGKITITLEGNKLKETAETSNQSFESLPLKSLNSNSNNLTSPNNINKPKKTTGKRIAGIWAITWRIIVGIAVLAGLALTIFQLIPYLRPFF